MKDYKPVIKLPVKQRITNAYLDVSLIGLPVCLYAVVIHFVIPL